MPNKEKETQGMSPDTPDNQTGDIPNAPGSEAPTPEVRVLYFRGKRGVEYDGFPNRDLTEQDYRKYLGSDEDIDKKIVDKQIPFSWESE